MLADLEKLSASMRSGDAGTVIPIELQQKETIGAAYTYFGQFIDHDLTEDRTALRYAGRRPPDQILNYRRHSLDLDHLYGDGPERETKRIYAKDGYSFALGEVLSEGQNFDVPLLRRNPQLADHRNGENVLVRQVHVMFLKLHNLIAQQLPANLNARDRFLEARREVVWQYQWLVRHDFLASVCTQEVFTAVTQNNDLRVDWHTNGFAIPIEFSQAAFRFGHSMVRPIYSLKGEHPRDGELFQLKELFGEAKKGPINPRMAIPWRRFLSGEERAMRMDTTIVSPLFAVPVDNIELFVDAPRPPTSHQLPFRTLRRGAANRLATGQQVRDRLCPEAPIPQLIAGKYDPWKHARELGLENDTPLWYYILLEAEIEANGLTLGTVGSRLVAEVIEGALRADPHSILSSGSQWAPKAWKSSTGQGMKIESLFDLAIFVGLA